MIIFFDVFFLGGFFTTFFHVIHHVIHGMQYNECLFFLSRSLKKNKNSVIFLVGKLNLRLRVFCEEIGFSIGEVSQFMFRISLDMSSYDLLP